MLRNLLRRRSSKLLQPGEEPHRDGFVYKVQLKYELHEGQTPYIRMMDDSGHSRDRFLLPSKRDELTIQFGGEHGHPPVFAHIVFSEAEVS